MNNNLIRNFVIIAHIDSGKSTLADRMLEITKTVPKEKMHPQMLDTMDLEQERGITIKLQPVRMVYRPSNYKHETLNSKQIQSLSKLSHPNSNNSNLKNLENSNLDIVSDLGFSASDLSNSEFVLNLIDTPGHVDFSYEVSRSLAAVEGAVLVVDASQGIQAQTLANLYHAQNQNLKIIPVINKIDLPNVQIEEVKKEISALLKIDQNEIILASAKTGEGVEKILYSIIKKIPPPKGDIKNPLKALIFDSVYDKFRGVIAYVKILEGEIQAGDSIKFLATGKTREAGEVGEFKLKYQGSVALGAGEIGYIITGAKDIQEIKVGDTIVSDHSPAEVSPISGFKIPESMVYASFYSESGDPAHLRDSLEKLKLNDSSLNFEPENSESFGQGFKCGFLGLLHLEIIKERLGREYGLNLIVTSPQVEYKIHHIGSKEEFEEPWVNLEIITPQKYLGQVMELVQSRRGIYKNTQYLGERVILEYESPLSEIIIDFYDKLKSISSGYASQNYELIGWRLGKLKRLDIILAGKKVEEFSKIVPEERLQKEAQNLARKLKELIPRQMFEVSIQAACGVPSTGSGQGKILAREDIPAMKKDVIAKLYGGDRTRKDKLLKKQAIGKKRLKQFGRVDIPNDVFLKVLKS